MAADKHHLSECSSSMFSYHEIKMCVKRFQFEMRVNASHNFR